MSNMLRPKDCADNDENLEWSAVVPSVSTHPELHPDDLLFNVADQIACRHALTTQWSTWHTWDYYNRIEPDATEAKDSLWNKISPFATCVGMTFQVAEDVRSSLAKTPGLAQYHAKLKTLESPISADSNQPFHCLTGIFLESYCIVVDLVFSAKAFNVPYNGSFETPPYIVLSGRSERRLFRYIAGPGGTRTLIMEWVGSDKVAVHFSEIDHHTALQSITWRAARETESDSQVPKKKGLVIRTTMSEQPIKIASTPLDIGFIVTACRVKVDFAHRTLTMQIPYEDWLLKPQNVRYLSRVQLSRMYKPVSDAVVNLAVDLSTPLDDDLVLEDLRLMGEVGERLGLAREEILSGGFSFNNQPRPGTCILHAHSFPYYIYEYI